MNYAMIDIGSNTVKMTVYGADKTIIKKYSHPTSLLSYIENGALTAVGIARLLATLTDYQSRAERDGARVYAYATASLRDLSNRDGVVSYIKERSGLAIDVVSGEEEARLSFDGIAAVSGIDPTSHTVLDLGGGSLEIAAYENDSLVAHSFRFGALAMYLRFVKNILPTREELSTLYGAVTAEAASVPLPKNRGNALAVGGSLRAFCHILAHTKGEKYDETRPYFVKREEAEAFLKKVTDADRATELMLIELEPKRIHTVTPGLCAFLALLDLTGHRDFTVVSGGTREGYLDRIIKKETI